jgi:hypothetical protein
MLVDGRLIQRPRGKKTDSVYCLWEERRRIDYEGVEGSELRSERLYGRESTGQSPGRWVVLVSRLGVDTASQATSGWCGGAPPALSLASSAPWFQLPLTLARPARGYTWARNELGPARDYILQGGKWLPPLLAIWPHAAMYCSPTPAPDDHPSNHTHTRYIRSYRNPPNAAQLQAP